MTLPKLFLMVSRASDGRCDVVVHGIRSVAAVEQPALIFGVNRADKNPVPRLQHIDLDFLGVGVGFFARAGLHANRGADLHVAARLAVNVHFAEFIFDRRSFRRRRETKSSENRARLVVVRELEPRAEPVRERRRMRTEP